MEQIYLDYNATTPLGESVIRVIQNELKTWGNPSSNYKIGKIAKSVIDNARQNIAQMINAKPSSIVFTSGGTEANNMAIYSAVKYMKKNVSHQPHVITSSIEHDATLKILEHLHQENEIDLGIAKPSKDGTILTKVVLDLINDRTCLISIMMANNETGVISPVLEIGKCLQDINKSRLANGLPNILLHTDAAQVIGKLPVSVDVIKADYISIAGHKFYGPRIGCLYFREGAPVYPLLYGGGQENGLRPGTENTPLIAGLGEAARLVTENIESFSKHLSNMRDLLQTELMRHFSNDEIFINFTDVSRLPNTLSVSFPKRNARDILKGCKYVVASTGSACHSSNTSVSRVLKECLAENLWNGTMRLSVGRETTSEDIMLAVEDLFMACKLL